MIFYWLYFRGTTEELDVTFKGVFSFKGQHCGGLLISKFTMLSLNIADAVRAAILFFYVFHKYKSKGIVIFIHSPGAQR